MSTSDVITLLTATAGIVVSYYFFIRSQRLKRPCWAIGSNNLIENSGSEISKVEVFYNHQKIENLTVSKLLFWNAGDETIERNHIVTTNPLRIVAAESVKLLDVEVLVQNNPYSDVAAYLSNDNLSISLTFDYLDRAHGAVLQVIHTGLSSADIRIEGSIKGVRAIRKKRVKAIWLPLPTPESFDRRIKSSIRRKLVAILFFCLSISVLIFASTVVVPAYQRSRTLFTVFALVYFLLPSLYYLVRAFDLLSNAPPRGLEIFEN